MKSFDYSSTFSLFLPTFTHRYTALSHCKTAEKGRFSLIFKGNRPFFFYSSCSDISFYPCCFTAILVMTLKFNPPLDRKTLHPNTVRLYEDLGLIPKPERKPKDATGQAPQCRIPGEYSCLLRNRRCIGMSLYKGEAEKMLASVRAFVV